MHFSIVLPLRNEAQLDELLSRVYDPASSEYRRFLSVSEFTDRFGPSEAEYQAVVDFAAANGLSVDRQPANRVVIPMSGTVAQIQGALHVQMKMYQHPTENRTFFSPDREPSLALSVPVLRVAGLDNFILPHPMIVRGQAAKTLSSSAVNGSGPGNSYMGSDMRAAYYGGNTLTGAGQTLALFQLDGYFQSDLDLTFSSAGQSYSVPIVNVLLDGLDGTPALTGEDVEQVMDIAQTIGMAPGLDQLRVYIGDVPVDVLNAIAADGVAKQVSISWAWQSADESVEDQAFKELAAQGQAVFVASGDDGAFAPGYRWAFPSEDPWVTAVGGSSLKTQSQNGAWASETAWSGSGGGPSLDNVPQPSWQAGTATAANGGSAGLRNVPDVAMEADFDNYACHYGVCSGGWAGTSYAAPRWAAYLALVNEQAAAAGDQAPGFINPTLYSIGKAAGGQFHDITSGSNPSTTDPSKSFPAVAGYDLVTGWGSPAGQTFIDALAPWSNPGFQLGLASNSLSINPGSSASLQIGIAVHNGFAGAVDLAVTGLPTGVTASWSANPVSDASMLTLAVDAGLPRGQYRISVTGVSGHLSARSSFTLLVNAPGFSITAAPMSFFVNGGSSYSLNFTVNGFAGFADPISFAIASDLPVGITAIWKTIGEGPPMLTLTAAKDATPGLFDLTILATAGKLSATTIVQMHVYAPFFVINVTPVPGQIVQGGSIAGTVNLGLEGPYDGVVSLTAPITPPGVTASFNPTSITAAQTSQVTLTASGNAPLGTGNLFLVGTAPGIGTFFATPLSVVAAPVPNFSLTESPTSLTIPQGGSGSATITVNPAAGFADNVSLSLPGFPGLSSSFSVNPTATSSVVTINVADSVPASGYWLKFTGTAGMVSAYGVIFLTVTPTYPFDMDITPNPISLTAGGSASGNVTITPHGALSGDVDLAVTSDLPDGISATFTPTSTQASSSLLIGAGNTVQPGNYLFNVSGTGANETVSKTVALTIAAPVPGARINSLSPAYAEAKGTAFALTVNGSGFDSNSVVYWHGNALPTQFLSATSLTANVTEGQLANPGIVTIQVRSADVTGSSTNSLQFEVDSSSAAMGTPAFPSPTQSVAAGAIAQFAVTLPSTATEVTLTCLNLPAGASCSYAKDSGAVSVTTASTTPAGSYQVTVVFTETLPETSSAMLLFLLLPPMALRRRPLLRRIAWICTAMVGLVVVANVIGCGSSRNGAIGTSPTPTPTYQVTSSGTVVLTVH